MPSQEPGVILVVDDDDAKRHTIVKILRKAGYRIREGETGESALRLASEKPSLIILDVQLPDMSGFEVCRRIKEDPATAAIPVLHISTTFVDLEDRIHGLEGGADGYLTDVLEPLELLATIRALLRTRRAEEAAEISSRQWQSTFDAISDGVALLDRSGRIVQINSALEKILGKAWHELSGVTINDLFQIPALPANSPFVRMIETGRREAVELLKGERWLRITVDPIRDATGSVKGGLCIASDITDGKRLHEELRKRAEELAAADLRKDEFLAMLAHELRNPLAPIANALEAIRLGRTDAEQMGESLDIAGRQVEHMARLLDDLLDVSRFTRGNVKLRKEVVDVVAILAQSVEISRPVIEGGRHELITSYPANPFWVHGDPTRLAQVVANLLNNAAKYTEPGGKITLSAQRSGEEAVIIVRDNGVGLTEEMLPRVFDLFAQEDRSLDRSQGGLGIGLTLVQSLVSLHGGSVEARSEGAHRGSEFIVRLPAASNLNLSRDGSGTAMQPDVATARVLRILVVDDSVDSARSLARVLKLWGYETRVAHEGPSAIEAAHEHEFDVVLLDIGLPGMDGYEVAKELREQFGLEKPILIALTGYGQEEDFAKTRSVGFDDHLVKPVSLSRLKGMLSAPESIGKGRGAGRSRNL